MRKALSGVILFANDLPAEGVEVRVFDRDTRSSDDDLTTSHGMSDRQGRFTVEFDPSGYNDEDIERVGHPLGAIFGWLGGDEQDRYLPYLSFRYQMGGQESVHTASLGFYQSEFRLPETRPLGFCPSIDGFHFLNSFTSFPLPVSVPGLPHLPEISGGYGLCGGMSSAAYDFFLAGRVIPDLNSPPASGTPLHAYLFRRAVDTFGALGSSLVTVARWTVMEDASANGTQVRTAYAMRQIKGRLNDQRATVIALIYERAASPGELFEHIWNNHQVLAYAYTNNPDRSVTLSIYDPNFPGNDNVTILAQPVTVIDGGKNQGGYRCVQKVPGYPDREVRGLFPMTYKAVQPPESI